MKAKLLPTRKLRLVESKGANGPYCFVASSVGIDDPKEGRQVHDITFEPEVWDAIANSACALSTIWLEGDLVRYTDPDKRYTVNEDDPKHSYERMAFRGELSDIEDSKGSALAFKRGARLPTVAQLRKRAMDAAGISTTFADAPAEEPAK